MCGHVQRANVNDAMAGVSSRLVSSYLLSLIWTAADGSVRAFRASARNEVYVQDVEAKRAQAEKERLAERERAKINPFAVSLSYSLLI